MKVTKKQKLEKHLQSMELYLEERLSGRWDYNKNNVQYFRNQIEATKRKLKSFN